MEITYEVTTKAGKTYTVRHNLTDSEAIQVLNSKPDPSAFERDLVAKFPKLSPLQLDWVHVLAHWALNPKTNEATREKFPNILAMLQSAREAGKKFPKIRLEVDGQPFVLALSRAGKVNVTDGGGYGEGTWFGAIQPSGEWREGRESGQATGILKSLETNPAGVASQHGVATGSCCFCNKDLSTKESRSVGYGPICAGKFGLPWGEVDAAFDQLGKDIKASYDAFSM